MNYKYEFIRFMAECRALNFGEFTLKSGRKAPYYINTGNYKTSREIAKLGEYYAQCIEENNLNYTTLFGPAYKGIPLVTSTAIALSNKYNRLVNYCFDRKEAKDHGEGGKIVGKSLIDGEKVVIVEDVITAGTAIRQVYPLLKSIADINISGMVISVDRMERGTGELSAVQEIKQEFGIDIYPIVTINDIIDAIKDGVIWGQEYLDKMIEYRKTYGVN